MALVQLPVVEQLLDAVRAVLAGARVGEVAASFGVSQQSVYARMVRYLAGGVAGLADRSRAPQRHSPICGAGGHFGQIGADVVLDGPADDAAGASRCGWYTVTTAMPSVGSEVGEAFSRQWASEGDTAPRVVSVLHRSRSGRRQRPRPGGGWVWWPRQWAR